MTKIKKLQIAFPINKIKINLTCWIIFIPGFERVAEELMGRRKWKLYQEVLARSQSNSIQANSTDTGNRGHTRQNYWKCSSGYQSKIKKFPNRKHLQQGTNNTTGTTKRRRHRRTGEEDSVRQTHKRRRRHRNGTKRYQERSIK